MIQYKFNICTYHLGYTKKQTAKQSNIKNNKKEIKEKDDKEKTSFLEGGSLQAKRQNLSPVSAKELFHEKTIK